MQQLVSMCGLHNAQVLATTEPAAVIAAFREPLEAALASAQDADRPRSYAAAEVLAGLLASGALFVADAGALQVAASARLSVTLVQASRSVICQGHITSTGRTSNDTCWILCGVTCWQEAVASTAEVAAAHLCDAACSECCIDCRPG